MINGNDKPWGSCRRKFELEVRLDPDNGCRIVPPQWVEGKRFGEGKMGERNWERGGMGIPMCVRETPGKVQKCRAELQSCGRFVEAGL